MSASPVRVALSDYYQASVALREWYRSFDAKADSGSVSGLTQLQSQSTRVRALYQAALKQTTDNTDDQEWLQHYHQRLEAFLIGKDLPEDHPAIRLEKAFVRGDEDAVLTHFNSLDPSTKDLAYQYAVRSDGTLSPNWQALGAGLLPKCPVAYLGKLTNRNRRVIELLVKNEFELLEAKKNQQIINNQKEKITMSTYNPYGFLTNLFPAAGTAAIGTYLMESKALEYALRSVNRRGTTVSQQEMVALQRLTERVEQIYTLAMTNATNSDQAVLGEIKTTLQKLQAKKEVEIKEPGYFLMLAMLQKDKPGAVDYFTNLQYETQKVAFKFLTHNLPSPNKGQLVNGRKGYVHDALVHLSRDFIYCLNLTAPGDNTPLYKILMNNEMALATEKLEAKPPRQRSQAGSNTHSTTSTTHSHRPVRHTPATTTNQPAKKGSNLNDVVTERFLEITEGRKAFDSSNDIHMQAVNFLTSPDNTYAETLAQKPKDEVINPIYGNLIFHPKENKEDADFLKKMEKRKWYEPARKALEAHTSYAIFVKGKKIVINSALINHYLNEMNWKADEKAHVYRFLKEVIKHCILCQANEQPYKNEKPRSRQIADLTRKNSSASVTNKSNNQKARNDLLIPFYTQGAKNDQGKTFEDILAMSDAELEKDHFYIQWLFPLFKGSDKNKTAPVLDNDLAVTLAQDQTFRTNLFRAFERMIAFYGCKVQTRKDNGNKEIVLDPNNELKWLTKPHNFLRITRILKCMTNLVGAAPAQAFLEQLEIIARSPKGKKAIRPADEKDSSLGIWRGAVKGQHVLARQQHQQQQQQPENQQQQQQLYPQRPDLSSTQAMPHPQQQQQQHLNQQQQQSLYPLQNQQQQQPQSLYPQFGNPTSETPTPSMGSSTPSFTQPHVSAFSPIVPPPPSGFPYIPFSFPPVPNSISPIGQPQNMFPHLPNFTGFPPMMTHSSLGQMPGQPMLGQPLLATTQPQSLLQPQTQTQNQPMLGQPLLATTQPLLSPQTQPLIPPLQPTQPLSPQPLPQTQ